MQAIEMEVLEMNLKRIKRIVAMTLCLILVLMSVSALAQVARIKVNGKLNLRKEASANSAILGSYKNGIYVAVIKKGSTWTKVWCKGKTGYMITKCLSFSSSGSSRKSSSGSSSSSGNSSRRYVKTENKDILNLRSGPNDSSSILGTYRNGTPVTLLKYGKYWSYVQVYSKKGYMYTRYLSKTK